MEKVKFEFDDISYMSQYANYIDNEEFLNIFNDKLSKYDIEYQEEVKNLIIDINENMPAINDKYNQIVFDKLLSKNLTISSLEEIGKLTTLLADQEYDTINFVYDDLLNNYVDEDIISTDLLHSIVNEDLKANGLNSQYRYLVPKLDFIENQTEYVALNVYLNDFDYQYKDYNEVLEDTLSEKYDEFFDEFFNKYTKSLSNSPKR